MIQHLPKSTLFPYTTLFRSLEEQVSQLITQSKIDQAEFYYAKGEILEETAHRTKFAPRKKRNTNRQALDMRSEEHTSELQSRQYLVCRLLLEKKKKKKKKKT